MIPEENSSEWKRQRRAIIRVLHIQWILSIVFCLAVFGIVSLITRDIGWMAFGTIPSLGALLEWLRRWLWMLRHAKTREQFEKWGRRQHDETTRRAKTVARVNGGILALTGMIMAIGGLLGLVILKDVVGVGILIVGVFFLVSSSIASMCSRNGKNGRPEYP